MFRDPTPDGVELMDGIPKFLPYTDSTLHYMNIDRDWSLRQDYPKTFTITVDELPKKRAVDPSIRFKFNPKFRHSVDDIRP